MPETRVPPLPTDPAARAAALAAMPPDKRPALTKGDSAKCKNCHKYRRRYWHTGICKPCVADAGQLRIVWDVPADPEPAPKPEPPPGAFAWIDPEKKTGKPELTPTGQKYIEDNQRLAYRVASKHFPHVSAADREDAEGDALLGFVLAGTRFDPSKSKLSTFGTAYAWGTAVKGWNKEHKHHPETRASAECLAGVADDTEDRAAEAKTYAAEALACLTRDELAVVTRRFGLDGQGERSPRRIAAELRVDAGTVQDVLAGAILKLQRRAGVEAEEEEVAA